MDMDTRKPFLLPLGVFDTLPPLVR